MRQALIIGLRYLRAKKSQTSARLSVIAIVGVALGVAALLVVLCVTGGFETVFRDRVLGVNAHVLVMKYGAGFSDYSRIVELIGKQTQVKSAAPFTIQELILAGSNDLKSVLVKGVDTANEKSVAELAHQLVAGTLPRSMASDANEAGKNLAEVIATSSTKKRAMQDVASLDEIQRLLESDPSDAQNTEVKTEDNWEKWIKTPQKKSDKGAMPELILGRALAEELSLKVDDRVKLMTPLVAQGITTEKRQGDSTFREFRVAGIFDAGFYEYDSKLVYVDLAEGQRFEDQPGQVTGVEIRLHDLDRSKHFAKDLENQLGGSYYTVDWSELNKPLFTALAMQKLVLTLVITTIIFVAAFNVVATLIMLVLDKKKEIAILKAIGAHDSTILSVFALQGIAMGVLGVSIGIGFGTAVLAYLTAHPWALDAKVYLIDHIPVEIRAVYFVGAALIAMSVSTFASIAPAWWAARLSPLSGLRAD